MTDDDKADLQATLRWIDEYAAQKLPPVHRKVIRSMLRVKPVAREGLSEFYGEDEVRAALERLVRMAAQ